MESCVTCSSRCTGRRVRTAEPDACLAYGHFAPLGRRGGGAGRMTEALHPHHQTALAPNADNFYGFSKMLMHRVMAVFT